MLLGAYLMFMATKDNTHLSDSYLSDVIGLAWADEVSFDDIYRLHGLREKDVIAIMRRHLKRRSFELWRKRVTGRTTKHQALLRAERRFTEPKINDLFSEQ